MNPSCKDLILFLQINVLGNGGWKKIILHLMTSLMILVLALLLSCKMIWGRGHAKIYLMLCDYQLVCEGLGKAPHWLLKLCGIYHWETMRHLLVTHLLNVSVGSLPRAKRLSGKSLPWQGIAMVETGLPGAE